MWLAVATACGTAAPPDPVDTSRAAEISRIARDRGLSTPAELLAALPTSLLESYVLVKDTASLHRASVESPRAILFGTDARFLLAVSSSADDQRRNTIEMAELDDTTGHWQFSELHLAPSGESHFSKDESACRSCHGASPRPIWGSYLHWPGAFGSDGTDVETDQAATLSRIRADTRELFHALPYAPGSVFGLRGRIYPYPNTSFNFELAAATAHALVTRAKQHEGYAERRRTALRLGWCEADPVGALATLGLDAVDVRLDLLAPDAVAMDVSWNQGSTDLWDVILFLVLDDVVDEDLAVAAAVAPVEDARRRFRHDWFEILGEARYSFLASAAYLDTFDFRPQQLLLAPVMPSLCDALRPGR